VKIPAPEHRLRIGGDIDVQVALSAGFSALSVKKFRDIYM